MMSTVILSPHFDDAVFNCWHAIVHENAAVLTIFAGKPAPGTRRFWDALCGAADGCQMVQRRRKENDEAVAQSGLGNRLINLDFLDAQYRGKPPTIEELAGTIVSNTPGDSIFLAPLAASPLRRHADHILARETALHLLRQGRRVNFYPDAPYMNLPSSGREQSLHKIIKHAEHSLGFAVTAKVKKLDANELGVKRRSMQAYKSQYVMTDLFSLGGLGRIGRRDYELVFEPKR